MKTMNFQYRSIFYALGFAGFMAIAIFLAIEFRGSSNLAALLQGQPGPKLRSIELSFGHQKVKLSSKATIEYLQRHMQKARDLGYQGAGPGPSHAGVISFADGTWTTCGLTLSYEKDRLTVSHLLYPTDAHQVYFAVDLIEPLPEELEALLDRSLKEESLRAKSRVNPSSAPLPEHIPTSLAMAQQNSEAQSPASSVRMA